MSSSGVGDGSILPGSSLEPFLELGRSVDDIDKSSVGIRKFKSCCCGCPCETWTSGVVGLASFSCTIIEVRDDDRFSANRKPHEYLFPAKVSTK